MDMQHYQDEIKEWILACLGEESLMDLTERNYRFLEEALELVQACGCSKEDALKLVDYVYSRPEGENNQEIGGVIVTLCALATAHDESLDDAAENELTRIWLKIEEIRLKQESKKIRSPLPGGTEETSPSNFGKQETRDGIQ